MNSDQTATVFPEPPLCILGPTASGKSSLAMALAGRGENVELVSIDSMQVYREMDIGTAKPTLAEQESIPHHLIDIADPADEFTVSIFQAAWRDVAADIASRGATPILVGGTGLYLRSVIDDLEIPGRFPDARAELEAGGRSPRELHARLVGLDPLAASRIEPDNERRIMRALEVTIGSGRPFSSYGPGLVEYPEVPFTLIGLRMDRDVADARINARYEMQMEAGFLTEVERLAARERPIGRTARQALGYRELLTHIEDGVELEDALEEAKLRTRRFARRQIKWYRRDPRIQWVDTDGSEAARAAAITTIDELTSAQRDAAQ